VPYPIGTLSRREAVAFLRAHPDTRVQYAHPSIPTDCGSWQACWLAGVDELQCVSLDGYGVPAAIVPDDAVFRVLDHPSVAPVRQAPVKKIAVFGGTFNPPHLGHVASVEYLRAEGYSPLVVPSLGHEFKPEAIETYSKRKRLAELAFGEDMVPIEEYTDPFDRRSALCVLLHVRTMCPDAEVSFAIGPDIDSSTWAGYEEIISEGFTFVRLPEHGENFHSTQIREHLAAGNVAELTRMLPAKVLAELLSQRPREPHVFVADAPRMLPTVVRRKGWTDHGLEGP
jgi:nicotinic acid mononucleotide adenylyltransferase